MDGIQGDAFLIKTDGEGNEEWTRTYGATNSYDYCVSVDFAPGGGYYLGGQRGSGPSSIDQWVVRTDENGDEIWSNNYGTPGGGDGLAQVTAMQNGDCVFASSWQTGSQFQQQGCIVRLDPDGGVLWSQRYGPVANAVLHTVQELSPSNDLIVCGAYGMVGNQYFGALLRTTSTGDSLWMRFYQYHDSLVSNGRGLFRDVVPTPDGGFIVCGTALPVSHADTLLYTQDVWVVKTDSMGCLEPGCHLITGMESQITNLKDVLRVWPNPVAQGGSVQLSIDLPANFEPQGALRLSVVSSDGRLVQEQRLPSLTSPTSISALEAGLYHLHLSDDTRWISGTRLVVQ
ncbi:MAG: T9SS type A sorting domain-containing protein [Flavobacteriales bacterium]|nr:T9SS type A sorting domain-containing protein [Flavobacteriales bacterium]MCB9165482.1 T9SS type A sorting domain-containing protein [Flavobacteriales bacterium]